MKLISGGEPLPRCPSKKIFENGLAKYVHVCLDGYWLDLGETESTMIYVSIYVPEIIEIHHSTFVFVSILLEMSTQ
jgi:hypothetical protein